MRDILDTNFDGRTDTWARLLRGQLCRAPPRRRRRRPRRHVEPLRRRGPAHLRRPRQQPRRRARPRARRRRRGPAAPAAADASVPRGRRRLPHPPHLPRLPRPLGSPRRPGDEAAHPDRDRGSSLAACSSSTAGPAPEPAQRVVDGLPRLARRPPAVRRLGAGRSSSEYDTNADGVPDVRKVFQVVGEGQEAPPVLELPRGRPSNHDGDGLFRFYNDQGRTSARRRTGDSDGRVDVITYFDNGEVVRREFGPQPRRHGRPADVPPRTARTAPSVSYRATTPRDFRPDYWEFYDTRGHVVRIGTDTTTTAALTAGTASTASPAARSSRTAACAGRCAAPDARRSPCTDPEAPQAAPGAAPRRPCRPRHWRDPARVTPPSPPHPEATPQCPSNVPKVLVSRRRRLPSRRSLHRRGAASARNGQVTELGTCVDPRRDKVELDGRRIVL